MRYHQLFESNTTLYHGDDFGTTKLQPRYMMHDVSNNQEGVGIYFTPDIKTAQGYGKYVSTISLNGLNIKNSRDLVIDTVKDRDAIRLLEYLNQSNEDFWYLLTDYGIEVASQTEVKPKHLVELHSMMRNAELRNWQIELAQATDDIQTFITGWNRIVKIDALYEEGRRFYAVTNTDIPVTLLSPTNQEESIELEEAEQLDEISVLSSWIQDLDIDHNVIFMTLINGRRYRILGVPPGLFHQWVRAPSKGKFWHSNIRGNYRVSRG